MVVLFRACAGRDRLDGEGLLGDWKQLWVSDESFCG